MKLLSSTALVVLFSLLTSTFSLAQVSYDGCFLGPGIPVPSIMALSLDDSAAARMTPQGPVILYNPNVVSWMHPETRLFVYFHECAHVVLNHVNFPNPNMEQQADCWAIRTAVGQNRLNQLGVTIVQNDLAIASRADWTHLPGPMRAINLIECLR